MSWDVALILLQEKQDIDYRELTEAGQGLALLRHADLTATGHLVRSRRQRTQLASKLQKKPPRVIFLQTGVGQTAAALAFLNEISKLPAGCRVAIGGIYGTLCSHEFTSHPLVDCVILGEWMEALRDLGATLRAPNGSPEWVDGIWWKSPYGWKMTQRRSYNPDFDQWPDPELSEFRIQEIIRFRGGLAPIVAARGFQFMASSVPDPLIRHLHDSPSFHHLRPPGRVAREGRAIMKTYRAQRFDFVDPIFPWQESWQDEFIARWTEQTGAAAFQIKAAAEYLLEPGLRKLREAGLVKIEFTLEGGNLELRKRNSELNIDPRRLETTLEICRDLGIEVSLRLLLGVPGESAETLREAKELAQNSQEQIEPEIFTSFPQSDTWRETERSLTGGNIVKSSVKEESAIRRDVVLASQELSTLSSVRKAERRRRRPDVSLDGLADFPKARLRSPLESAATLTRFHGPTRSEDVLALRVPTELSFDVILPRDPVVHFSILQEPALPGERSRLPVSFSVKVEQNKRVWRLFHKILIQALDPDSRNWHTFTLPVSGAVRGEAVIILETLIFGRDASFIPPERDLWAGWADFYVTSQSEGQTLEETDEELMRESHSKTPGE